jgi:DNA-binding transcriptional LysR family regulator
MDDRNVDLLEENVDVAIRLGDLSDSSLTARKIGEAERLVVASPQYLARHGSPRSPGELVGHEAVAYSPNVGVEQWRFRKGTSDVSVSVPSRLVCTAAEGVREAVLAGLGLAMISRWMMTAELRSAVVTPLLTEWELPSTALWAVFPAGRLPTTKARAFVNWFETGMVT